MTGKNSIKLITAGDINGFFGVMTDNLATLSLVSMILMGFGFPFSVISGYIVPGTAFAVFIGDILFMSFGIWLTKKLNRNDICAMPAGLDTPSSIGLAVAVIGPAFVAMKQGGMTPETAGLNAWYLGMAGVIIIGVIKIAFVPFANSIQKIVPMAGLLGSLAAVCIGLIGFTAVVEIFSMPIVGLISLALVIYTLVARINLPKKLPGVFIAIFAGTVIYHTLGNLGIAVGPYFMPVYKFKLALPVPNLNFILGLSQIVKYLPIVIPFAILVVIGNINTTESAVAGGDPYKSKSILFIDGVSTLLGGFFGSICQTTAYIGQPAYKKLGSRIGYLLLTAVFIGCGGVFGYLAFFVLLIPKAVLAPMLLFISLEIVAQSFSVTPKHHAAAVCFSFFPCIARAMSIQFQTLISPEKMQGLITQSGQTLPIVLVITALGAGFILVSMLWGAFMAEIIDKHLKKASIYLILLAVFSFFGIVHSAALDGSLYFPWNLSGPQQTLAYYFSTGYLAMAGFLLIMSYTGKAKDLLRNV